MASGYRNYANSFATCFLLIVALGVETGMASVAGVISASNMFSQAVALMESGANQEAAQVYDDIIRQGRFSRDIHRALYLKGVCLQAMQQDQQALVCWNTILTRYTHTEWDDDVLLEMGNTYTLNMNQPEKALLCYERLIRNYPHSERLSEAQFQLGVAAYMKGYYGKARASFETVLRKDPQGGLAGETREWLGRTSMALSGAPGAGKLMSGTNSPSRKTIGLRRDLAAELAEAESLQSKGKNKEALMVFQRIVKNNVKCEGYERALYRLGQCQAELGGEKQALESWEQVLKRAKWDQSKEWADDALLAMAETWLEKLGAPDKAFACCQTLQIDYPQSELIPKAEHVVGLVYFYRDELDKARAIFEQELAQLRAGLAKTPQAPDTNALALHSPDSLRDREAGGLALRSSQSEAGPLTGLERLIAACQGQQAGGVLLGADLKASAHAEPLIRRGDMQFTAKDYAKARLVYEKAAREAEGTETAAYALLQAGRCYNQLRRYREALRCYDRFLTKYKESQYADDALVRAGVIYVGPLRDMASGAKMYTTLLERYPKSNEAETAQYHLATLAYWKKDWDKAMALYRQVVETWPDGRYAEFIAEQRAPELASLMQTKSKTKRGTS